MAAAEPLAETPAPHPLEALTAAEVEQAIALLKPRLNGRAAFCSVALSEPDKAAVQALATGETLPRTLRFMGYDYPEGDPPDGDRKSVV